MVPKVIYLIIFVSMFNAAAAFEISSQNYSAQSYHLGLAGAESTSSNFSARSTITFQQGSGEALSTTYVMNVGHFSQADIKPPVVVYLAPLNASVLSTSPPFQFRFNVTDWSTISNCQLFLDGIYLENKTSIIHGENSFTRNLGNGQYNYSIRCFDSFGNTNPLEVLYFSVAYYGKPGSGGRSTTTPEEPAEDLIDDFFNRQTRPQLRASDLKLVAFLGLLWAAWYLFLFKKERKEEYIR